MKHLSAEVRAAFFGWAFSLFYFWPGLMSNDSVAQLHMARVAVYGNWHPPSMSLLWGWLDKVIAGPSGMLILQLTLLWLAYVGLSRALVSNPQKRWKFVLIVALFPVFFQHSGIIWKDVQMSMALLCACAILFRERVGWGGLCVAGTLLIYATTVRHNAAVACIPLWGLLISKRVSWNRLQLAGAGFAATVVVFFASGAVIQWVTQFDERYPLQQILIHDIAAVSLAEKKNFLPPHLDPQRSRTQEHFEKLYTPREVVPLFCCDGAPFRVKMITAPEYMDELKQAWFATVTSHPFEYVKHRMRVLKELMGMGAHACNPFHRGIVDNHMGLKMGVNKIRDEIEGFYWRLRNTIPFRAWPFLLLLFYQVYRLRRGSLFEQAFVVSGLFYFLPYLLVATTCDFRMSLWSAQVAWMASAAQFLGRRKPL